MTAAFEQAFWYAALALQAGLLARLLTTRLYRSFPLFSAYLGLEWIRELVLLAFAPTASSGHYWVLWAWTEPLIILLEFAAVYEAVGRIGSTYPQLGRVGRFVVLACVVAAAIMAAFSIAGDIRTLDRWTGPVVIRHASFDVRRAASIGLAGVIACVLGCTLFWQSRMPRNTRLHACLLCLLLAANGIAYTVLDYHLLSRRNVSILTLGIACILFILWILKLSLAGEETPAPSRIVSDEEAGESRDRFRTLVRNVRAAVWGR
jgi:hypothetical protein